MSHWRIRQYIQLIQQGAVFAYPTDTIWGFGCHPLYEASIHRIQQIKQRSRQKGLILLGSHLHQFIPFIDHQTFESCCNEIAQPQTSPTTWIVKASQHCPAWLTKKKNTIALRITKNTLIQQICEPLNSPIISTSANFSGHPPARNSVTIYKHFRNGVDFIINGPNTGTGQASEIRVASSGKILRP